MPSMQMMQLDTGSLSPSAAASAAAWLPDAEGEGGTLAAPPDTAADVDRSAGCTVSDSSSEWESLMTITADGRDRAVGGLGYNCGYDSLAWC